MREIEPVFCGGGGGFKSVIVMDSPIPRLGAGGERISGVSVY